MFGISNNWVYIVVEFATRQLPSPVTLHAKCLMQLAYPLVLDCCNQFDEFYLHVSYVRYSVYILRLCTHGK